LETFTAVIEAIAKLIWPLIFLYLVWAFRPAVGALLDSAKSRKFTIKVGGQELSMDEVSEEQQKDITDLRSQLTELKKRVDGIAPSSGVALTALQRPAAALPTSVLWVDDHPKNNSYFLEQLHRLGIKVDTALSTDQAMELFSGRFYDCVISDMGRRENGTDNPDAGVDLLKQVRSWNRTIPFVIFSSGRGIKQFGSDALQMGATGITSSATELFELLNLNEAAKRA